MPPLNPDNTTRRLDSPAFSAKPDEQLSPYQGVKELFLEEIAQLPPLPITSRIMLAEGRDQQGKPVISISHTANYLDRSVDFRYQISFAEADTLPHGQRFRLNETNNLTVPRLPWNAQQIEEIRKAWKQITVADPLLYRRHTATEISPEAYQVKACSKLLDALIVDRFALCHMATGTGKTVVAMMVGEKYNQIQEAAYGRESKGKVLFIVDRTLLLGEAEEKLNLMFPGKYSTGKIYSGSANYDADFIFATPSSLMQSGRLNTLVESGRVSLVIFDETHHLPAAELKLLQRMLVESSEANDWDTAFLGLSATIKRRDERSVISFYNRDVTHQYDKLQAWSDGNLVGIDYVAADMMLDPTRGLYSPAQFPRLWEIYCQSTANDIDKRSLIICPTIDHANALAGDFNERQVAIGQGAQTVSLTSELQTRNPRLFSDSYQAWKAQAWPKDSPFADRPVPKVIAAVDMFGEGIDVPAINNVLLWAKVGSPLVFIQIIGRALRVSPFKPFARVIDVSGAYQNPQIREHLRQIDKMVTWIMPQSVAEKTGEPRQPAPAPIAFQHSHLDVPSHMEYVFGNYDSIPRSVFPTLDGYIAKKLGFGSIDNFEAQMSSIRQQISQQCSANKIEELRDILRHAFDDGTFYCAEKDNVISRSASTLIVYCRLAELLTSRDSAAKIIEAQLLRIFPEFSAEYEVMMRNRASNLRELRRSVFEYTPSQVIREFYQALLEGGKLEVGGAEWQVIFSEYEDMKKGSSGFWLLHSEGRQDKSRGDATLTAASNSTKRTTIGNAGWQELAISCYLLLPQLENKLVPSDFLKPTEEFQSLLHERGLFSTQEALLNHLFKALQRDMTGYLSALGELQNSTAFTLSSKILSLFDVYKCTEPSFWKDLTSAKGKKLLLWHDQLTNAHAQGVTVDATNFKSIREQIATFLNYAGVLIVEKPQVKTALPLVLSQRKSKEYSIYVEKIGKNNIPIFCTLLDVAIERDYFGRPHATLSPPQDPASLAVLRKEELGAEFESERLRQISALLTHLNDKFSQQVVFILPTMTTGNSLIGRLTSYLGEHPELDFNALTNVTAIILGSGKRSLTLSRDSFRVSSLRFASEKYLHYIDAILDPNKHFNPSNSEIRLLNLHRNYIELYGKIVPDVTAWRQKLAEASLDPRLHSARDLLDSAMGVCLDALCEGMTDYKKGRKNIYDILSAVVPDSIQVETSIALTIIKLAGSYRYQGVLAGCGLPLLAPELKSTIAHFQREFGLLKYLALHGASEVSTDLEREIGNTISRLVDQAISVGMFSKESCADLDRLTSKIRTLTEHDRTRVIDNGRFTNGSYGAKSERSTTQSLIFATGSAGRTVHGDSDCPRLSLEVVEKEVSPSQLKEEQERYVCCRICYAGETRGIGLP